MKYISIDIETTGLSPIYCNILEVGAIIEDTTRKLPREACPTFHAYMWKGLYTGEPYALAMNGHIIKRILELKKQGDPMVKIEEFGLGTSLFEFINSSAEKDSTGKSIPWTVAGKNVSGFDLQFLNRLPMWSGTKINHRTLDPTPYFVDWSIDTVPPDLTTCKKRARLPELVTHAALDDAWDVIELLRTRY